MRTQISFWLAVVIIGMAGCSNPGLNETQRQQLKEGKANRAIRQISKGQIAEEILIVGNELLPTLSGNLDSIGTYFTAFWRNDTIKIDDSKINEVREAYLYSKAEGQQMPEYNGTYSNDSLLYAKPTTIAGQEGIWFIILDKKEVIKRIK